MGHHVELIVRDGCGSCERVAQQIQGPVVEAGATFAVLNVADDRSLAAEFGDRVPVVLVDGEEFACWEVDTAELVGALL